jgi:hypothetical protein
MRNLQERQVIALDSNVNDGDPKVSFPEVGRGEDKVFALLAATVADLADSESAPLSGLKDEMRKSDPTFSEKRYGYSGFLQFVKAATARGVVQMDFDEESGAYAVSVPE